MTLNDIFSEYGRLFNKLLNYDLNNFGQDIFFPVIKGIFILLIFLIVIGGIFFVSLYFYEEIKKWLRYKKKGQNDFSSIKTEIKINRNDWEKVGNREGLYCYYCTKKLHLESLRNGENYYCDDCYLKLSK